MTAAARKRSSPGGKDLLLAKEHFQALLDVLISSGFRVIGPTVSQGAIVYDDIRVVENLPRGWTDDQSAGQYRLKRRDDDALFGYVVGPHSWKQYLFPPQATVAEADRTEDGWAMRDVPDDEPASASCSRHALPARGVCSVVMNSW